MARTRKQPSPEPAPKLTAKEVQRRAQARKEAWDTLWNKALLLYAQLKAIYDMEVESEVYNSIEFVFDPFEQKVELFRVILTEETIKSDTFNYYHDLLDRGLEIVQTDRDKKEQARKEWERKQALKKSARAKLTDEEIKALNL